MLPGWTESHSASRAERISVSDKDSRTLENNWEISSTIKGGVKDVWEASLTAKYGGKFISSQEFTAEDTFQIRSLYLGYLSSTVPVKRYTGSWRVLVRFNGQLMTEFTILSTLDQPNPGTGSKTVADTKGVTRKLTDQELAAEDEYCKP